MLDKTNGRNDTSSGIFISPTMSINLQAAHHPTDVKNTIRAFRKIPFLDFRNNAVMSTMLVKMMNKNSKGSSISFV